MWSHKGLSGESISTALLAKANEPKWRGDLLHIHPFPPLQHHSPSDQMLSAVPMGIFRGGLAHGAGWVAVRGRSLCTELRSEGNKSLLVLVQQAIHESVGMPTFNPGCI